MQIPRDVTLETNGRERYDWIPYDVAHVRDNGGVDCACQIWFMSDEKNFMDYPPIAMLPVPLPPKLSPNSGYSSLPCWANVEKNGVAVYMYPS
jgi:hypothetical protein